MSLVKKAADYDDGGVQLVEVLYRHGICSRMLFMFEARNKDRKKI
jgi:hypothetical protein